MDSNHFLITRFSVPFKDYANDKNGNAVRTDDWLKHRFSLFERFCLPSVKAQSCQDFNWLVYFDKDTPNKYKDKIEQIQQTYNNFVPRFVVSGSDFMYDLETYISSYANTSKKLITSRIDNDDAIHQNYINLIQKESENCFEDTLLNFKWGIQLDLKSGLIYQSKDESNPFISRVCSMTDKTNTVFEFEHHEAKNYLPIKQLTDTKGWLVIIHDKNVINSIGGKPLKDKFVLTNYNVSIDLNNQSPKVFFKALIRFYYKAIIYKYFK